MPVIAGLNWTFDTVADDYAQLRPGYPEELYRAVLAAQPLGETSHALEIGIGGGQATPPILATGAQVTAVEPGEHFCGLCREKFAAWPGFTVLHSTFEDAALPASAFDLVYSASAFHWVPEAVGYPKVLEVLRPGGVFARFANHPHPDLGRPAMTEAIQQAYDRYYAPFHHRPLERPRLYTEEQAARRAAIAARYGFTDVSHALFRRTRSFTAEGYVRLLGTYSDHIVIPEPTRTAFFGMIREAIEAHGGVITVYDVIDLQLARKPL